MDNFDFARKNGFLLLLALLLVWLIPYTLRHIFSIWSEAHYIDANDPTAGSRYEKSILDGRIRKKPYDDRPY